MLFDMRVKSPTSERRAHSIASKQPSPVKSEQSRKESDMKILLVGDRDIGKSAFAKRFVWKRFEGIHQHQHQAGMKDLYRKGVVLDGRNLHVDLLDFYDADIEDWKIQDNIISQGDGFILMYSANRRSSYERLETFYQSILRVKGEDSGKSIILVSTQCDSLTARAVSLQEGRELGRQFGCRYFETSAKTGDNVKAAVGYLIQRLLRDGCDHVEDTTPKDVRSTRCAVATPPSPSPSPRKGRESVESWNRVSLQTMLLRLRKSASLTNTQRTLEVVAS
ncbi:P-loop containing nucleoside triphosphate hydrolase protein [Pluteus cervinus]|uniref:P-loop containing nucleoside triphosphate hydrolase protein n=1 Tax=Pluteus cervinus TaxID=181527 RepID=A0ACD3B376_9AGAR|nr:P-loop containing nucleoside triphosphate hydrolase protein [Pluteus cervinus]